MASLLIELRLRRIQFASDHKAMKKDPLDVSLLFKARRIGHAPNHRTPPR